MDAPALSRQQRRRLKRLCDEVDRLIETDRRFFKRRPDRSYRIRRAYGAKVEVEALVNGLATLQQPPGGFARFVAVRQFAPGVRGRLFVTAPAGAETDLGEDLAQAIYNGIRDASPFADEINRRFETLAEKLVG